MNEGSSVQQIRGHITRLGPWHHDVEVAPGVRTGDPALRGNYPPELGTPEVYQPERTMGWLVKEVYGDGLAGRSVLDCACNAGGYLFAAKQLGAGRCFGFDAREHWIAQARFLAEHLPSDGMEFSTLDLASLPGLGLEPFDVTIFNGIFYHLPDPVAGLRVAAEHTKELLVVNTSTRPGPGDALVLSRESATEVASGVDGLAWLPTGEGVLRAILEWCGFPHARVRFDRKSPVKDWRRIEIIGARREETFAHFDAWRAEHEPQKKRGLVQRLLRRA